jgi:hypothetical protein
VKRTTKILIVIAVLLTTPAIRGIDYVLVSMRRVLARIMHEGWRA